MAATRATRRGPAAPLAAYVLHRYEWSESSLILDVFTREQGRIAVAAKGARRPFSQLRSVLLPFQRLIVSVSRLGTDAEASEIQTLRAAEWAGGGAMPTGSALFNGFYLNELLMKLLGRHDPHPALFDLYAATLPSLGPGDDAAVGSALRAFELGLLREIGLLPDLGVVTATQQPLGLGAGYALRPEGGVAAADATEAAIAGEALIGLQAALQHGSLAALQTACAASGPALKTVLRGVVQYHLGASQLRTRQVMRGLQGLQSTMTTKDTPR